jgi:carboxyl-terminal processing protease
MRSASNCLCMSILMKRGVILLIFLFCFASISLTHAHPLGNYRPQLEEVVGLVEEHFYDAAAVSSTQWKEAVRQLRDHVDSAAGPDQLASKVNSLLAALNTSHTHYYSKDDPKRYQLLGVFKALFEQDREDLFVYDGIGIATGDVDGQIVVVSVFDGFPAQKADLRFGDRIVSVDNVKFHPIDSFKGRTGKTVRIKVDRHGVATEINVQVVKIDGRTMFEKAAKASVRFIDHQGKKIGYIHLWSYAGTQYQELLRQQLLWGELSKSDALVLDLRDGWGGADLNYLNLFRAPIASTSFRGRDGSTGTYSGVWEKPVGLLVNERSTSGKELFTYGFKKLRIGPIIGAQTAGAVVAGRVFLLSNGDVLYLAVRDVSVDGMRLEGNGVKPDIIVDRSPMRSIDGDSQLQKAIEEVAKKIRSR